MGYSAYLYKNGKYDYAGDCGTLVGFADFAEWIDTLPTSFKQLHELRNSGFSDDVSAFTEELKQALDEQAPEADDVLSTSKAVLEALKNTKSHQALVINQGIGIDLDENLDEEEG